AQNQIEVARLWEIFSVEERAIVVRRKASNPQIVEEFSRLLRLAPGPFEIRRVEFDALITHPSHGSQRGLRIPFKFLANGIELQPDGNRIRGAGIPCPRKDRGISQKPAA